MRSIDMEYKDVAEEPLMVDEAEQRLSESSDSSTSGSSNRNSPRYCLRRLLPWYFHCLLMVIYTTGFVVAILRSNTGHKTHNLPHYPLPAREGLEWENRRFRTELDHNPFVGEPRDELNHAWHNLLQHDNIKVPRDYLDELGLNSIYTKDGKYGIASLSVYHSIHCLKKVHQMMYKEFYHEGKTSITLNREKRHADHCLEYIREHVMCQPDLSLVTFRWINNTAQYPEYPAAFYATNFDAAQHTCAKWEPIDTWAGERSFNLLNFDELDRPGVDEETEVIELKPIKGEKGYEESTG